MSAQASVPFVKFVFSKIKFNLCNHVETKTVCTSIRAIREIRVPQNHV